MAESLRWYDAVMSSADDVQVPEATEPTPPPFWWTKRLMLAAVVLTLGLGIAWTFWAREAKRRVDAEIAAIRARGEPLDAADFDVAPIPDPLNATVSIVAAMRAVPGNEQNFVANVLSRLASAPLQPADRVGLDRVALASTTMRSLARTARFQPGLVWTPNPMINPVTWANQTPLPRTLAVNAMREHVAGNDAEAVEIVRDMLFVADSLDRSKPNLIMHLLAMVNGVITFDAVSMIAPDLQILPMPGATTRPSGPASREQVNALIRGLLDDQDMQRGLARGFQVERAHLYSAMNSRPPATALPEPLLKSIRTALSRPWANLEILHTMQSMDELIAAAESADKALPLIAEEKRADAAPLTNFVREQSTARAPKFGARLEQQLLTLTRRRISAIRLAIRLYQLDHAGAFPTQLNQLVPDYLPTLPEDPLQPGGKSFGYSRWPEPVITSSAGSTPLTPSRRNAPATTSTSSGS